MNAYTVLMLKLRAIREQRGMSLRQLAKVSEVHLATIVRLESGLFDPRLSTLEKIARALGVTVPVLLGGGTKKKGG